MAVPGWAAEPARSVEAPVAFPVKAVRFEGNTLLPETALAAAAAAAVGEGRTLADLKKTAAAVQKLYRDAGYAGVVAYVPPQAPADGQVLIRILEGKLARINISGNKAYTEDNIRHSLPRLRVGETPVVPDIDRDIQFVNENSPKNLRVTLAAGASRGEIDANVEVAEEDPLQFRVTLDNTGNEATGKRRLSVGMQHANLWGLDHGLTLQYQTSPEEPSLVQVYSAGYRLPLYGRATSLDFVVAHSSVENGVTMTPAGPLEFTGKGDIAGVRVNRYLSRLGEYDHRITAGADWRDYSSVCSLGSFGSAGCGTAAGGITVHPLVLAYAGQVERPEQQWGIHVALVRNPDGDAADFAQVRSGAQPRYTIWRFSAFANRALSDQFSVNGRISAQYTNDALIPGEQFGLGGAGSVRGYLERERAGDSGLFASLELHGPNLAKLVSGPPDMVLRPLVFVDAGEIVNENDLPCTQGSVRCQMASVGAGARLTLGKRLTARLDVGRTLNSGSQSRAGRTHGHFSVTVSY